MKIRVLSDLHIEFSKFTPSAAPADVVVLAGDISIGHHGIEWARNAFPNSEIVYVLGNHEFYRGQYERVLERAAQAGATLGVHVLECASVVIDGVRFLGTTLWTDFETPEDGESESDMAFAMRYARDNMNDYALIRYQSGLLTPALTRELHLSARDWLTKALAEPFDGQTVVVTHHLPHRKSVDPQFQGHPLNPAFVSHMPELVRRPVHLWIHGHTHCSCDYVTEGTRVICNPRGYVPHERNPQFDPELTLDM